MITREADYAVRCVLYLSRNPEKVSSVKEMTGPMHIPQSFLAKILQRLVKGGIVQSVRGAGGGFRLARDPKDITLYDVIKTTSGPLFVNACTVDDRNCELSGVCAVHPIWNDIRDELEAKLDKYNFKSLAAKQWQETGNSS
jgi:Rrf2 family protein